MSESAITLVPTTSPLVFLDPRGDGVLVHDGSPPEVMRERIAALTQRMLAQPGEHREMKVEHQVLDGLYKRRLHIPKGTLLVGKIHLKACVNVVESGDISVLTELSCVRVTAGATAFSARGVQKVGLAHEDTVFVNIFRTDLTDITAIEAEIATTAHADLQSIENQPLKELQCL